MCGRGSPVSGPPVLACPACGAGELAPPAAARGGPPVSWPPGRGPRLNPRSPGVHGRTAVTSLAQIDEPVDVAYLMVPGAAMLDALSDAAAAGIRNAVILSSGYGEAGVAGRAAQRALVERAGE